MRRSAVAAAACSRSVLVRFCPATVRDGASRRCGRWAIRLATAPLLTPFRRHTRSLSLCLSSSCSSPLSLSPSPHHVPPPHHRHPRACRRLHRAGHRQPVQAKLRDAASGQTTRTWPKWRMAAATCRDTDAGGGDCTATRRMNDADGEMDRDASAPRGTSNGAALQSSGALTSFRPSRVDRWQSIALQFISSPLLAHSHSMGSCACVDGVIRICGRLAPSSGSARCRTCRPPSRPPR